MKNTLHGINSRLEIAEENVRNVKMQQYKLFKMKIKGIDTVGFVLRPQSLLCRCLSSPFVFTWSFYCVGAYFYPKFYFLIRTSL